MVFTNKYTQDLITKFPNFRESISFNETIDLYEDGTGTVNPYTVFTALTIYVVDEIIQQNKSLTQAKLF